MPKQFFCEGREPNFKFGSAISSLWLRHKLAVEKSAHQCDFSTLFFTKLKGIMAILLGIALIVSGPFLV